MALPLHWVDVLFQKFEAFYGAQFAQKWVGCDVSQVKQEWAEGLGRFDGETLKAALAHCRDNNQFPPSLPEFIVACKAYRVRPEHQLMLTHKFERSERGAEMLAGIKAMLKKGEQA